MDEKILPDEHEVVAYNVDSFGYVTPITKFDLCKGQLDLMKIRYFNHVTSSDFLDYESFREEELAWYKQVMDFVHDKYADHMEGIRSRKNV